jgi:hypothetical protein
MKNLLILIILSSSFKSFSWSKDGHEIVAKIAKSYLKKPVLDSVNKYLDTLSFEEASTWMDDQRKNHAFDYLKPWHYVNIAKDATYVETEKPNLINQLQLAINNLKNYKKLPASDIAFNLKIVFHLVGDLHQPLHCAYLEDKGGNDIDLEYLGKKDNLHHVWDKRLIETNKIDSAFCISFINSMDPKQVKKMSKINVLAWVNESRNLLPFVYGFKDKQLNLDYSLMSNEVVTTQLIRGGIRLAAILNSSFSK